MTRHQLQSNMYLWLNLLQLELLSWKETDNTLTIYVDTFYQALGKLLGNERKFMWIEYGLILPFIDTRFLKFLSFPHIQAGLSQNQILADLNKAFKDLESKPVYPFYVRAVDHDFVKPVPMRVLAFFLKRRFM